MQLDGAFIMEINAQKTVIDKDLERCAWIEDQFLSFTVLGKPMLEKPSTVGENQPKLMTTLYILIKMYSENKCRVLDLISGL